MSEHVGDRKGSAPFKDGTIKYACYEVLKHAGPRGLTVRPRVLFPARASLPPRTPPPTTNSRSVAPRVVLSFLPFPSVPSFARQVAEIVRHIRDGGLAKLGGATPANTIVGQLSKGKRVFLLPSQRSPREKECVHPSRTYRAWLTYYSYPTPRLRRRRQLLARVQGDVRAAHGYVRISPVLSRRVFFSRARARTPPRLLSARVPLISRTVQASPI